jgi:hypothetical protein
MFNWYEEAQVCYAYLSDVPERLTVKDHHKDRSAFCNSRWFKRGWTLQELLAPPTMIFFDEGWVEIGTKVDLRTLISSITGIENLFGFREACIAQKMSWASKRKTTRPEDMAYCLMGLFKVNMPLLYGEGSKAFYRLQLEIIKESDDESIFSWCEDEQSIPYESGLLARSPAAFQDSGDIESTHRTRASPYAMTNQGLQITLPLVLISESPQALRTWRSWQNSDRREREYMPMVYATPLNCITRKTKLPVVIKLRRADPSGDSQKYYRASCEKLHEVVITTEAIEKTIFIPQAVPVYLSSSSEESLEKRKAVGLKVSIHMGQFRQYLEERFFISSYYVARNEQIGTIPATPAQLREGDEAATLTLTFDNAGTYIVQFESRKSKKMFVLKIDSKDDWVPRIELLRCFRSQTEVEKFMIDRKKDNVKKGLPTSIKNDYSRLIVVDEKVTFLIRMWLRKRAENGRLAYVIAVNIDTDPRSAWWDENAMVPSMPSLLGKSG